MEQRQDSRPGRRFVAKVALAAVVLAGLTWMAIDGIGDEPSLPAPGPQVAPPAEPATAPGEAADLATPASEPPAAAVAAAPEERIEIQGPITEIDPETRAALEAKLERERLADARFHQGVEASQVRARDIDTRVRDAFQRVDLDPELLDGGFMRGLRIRSLEGGSPLDDAGFRPGDLLVRLDDRPLDDPAELADVMASAGPELSLCALRGATEFCRELSLR